MQQVFYDAPLAVQIHAISAVIAIILGPFVIWRRRRDTLHRVLGYVWVTEMATVALSSFWIVEARIIGPFSPIHLLSLWTLYVLWHGVAHARAGRVREHQGEMKGLYIYGMGIAGGLTFLPGRRLNTMLFGEAELLGLIVIALIAVVLIVFTLRQRGQRNLALHKAQAVR